MLHLLGRGVCESHIAPKLISNFDSYLSCCSLRLTFLLTLALKVHRAPKPVLLLVQRSGETWSRLSWLREKLSRQKGLTWAPPLDTIALLRAGTPGLGLRQSSQKKISHLTVLWGAGQPFSKLTVHTGLAGHTWHPRFGFKHLLHCA